MVIWKKTDFWPKRVKSWFLTKKSEISPSDSSYKKIILSLFVHLNNAVFSEKNNFCCSNGILVTRRKNFQSFYFFVYRGLRGHFNIWRATKKLLSPCLFVLSRFVFLKNMKILWSQLFSGYLRITVFFDQKKSENSPSDSSYKKNILSLFVHINNVWSHPLVFPTIDIWHSKIQDQSPPPPCLFFFK